MFLWSMGWCERWEGEGGVWESKRGEGGSDKGEEKRGGRGEGGTEEAKEMEISVLLWAVIRYRHVQHNPANLYDTAKPMYIPPPTLFLHGKSQEPMATILTSIEAQNNHHLFQVLTMSEDTDFLSLSESSFTSSSATCVCVCGGGEMDMCLLLNLYSRCLHTTALVWNAIDER